MKPTTRHLLRQEINKQFGKGINKVDLFEAMEAFIDIHYPPEDPKYHHHVRQQKDLLKELVEDIQSAGGLKKWKRSITLVFGKEALTKTMLGLSSLNEHPSHNVNDKPE